MTDQPIVDAHHHFWNLGLNYYPWLSDAVEKHFFLGDYSALKQDFLPADYRRVADGFEIVATVHVEAEWDRNAQVAETEWLSSVAAREGMPNAIVGHVWLAADNCEEVLRGHMRHPLFRGVRSKPVTSLTPDTMTPGAPGTMQDPNWRRGFSLLRDLGLTYDLRVPYWHLYEATEIALMFPEVPIVLNHTGFPWDRSEDGLVAWRSAMRAIAACPNVRVKLSELGLADATWTVESNRGVVLDAVDIFGPERCMWASNFPVAGLRVSYREQLEGFLEILPGLTAEERDGVFRRNAANFYGIELA
ncbi:MAG: amidohydrolase family protein [Rhodospirillaceae bacterium]|nr:amidohydrolase family protein [Rhodospirillaceae bacterium]